MEERELEGRVAVVTGGGRGFGRAFGYALAAHGAHVVLADIDAAACEASATGIRADGGEATAFPADVTDAEQIAALVDHAVAGFGGIDVLVNNAGLHSAAYNQSLATSGLAKVRRLFDVNVMGVITCTLAAQSHMAGRRGASIFNISSSAAYGCPTAYGVTKLAVQGLTMMSARELGPEGIRVNAIAPGLIFTDTIRTELSEATVAQVKAQQFLPEEGAESDVVEALLYLCSKAARFVSGETLRVSAGFSLSI
jgi:3-oxoacyl-[acyl-carrier protein] reductase